MTENRVNSVKSLLHTVEHMALKDESCRDSEERDFRRTSIQIASEFGVAKCVRNAIIGIRLQGSALKSWSVY
jgi:hypothetical protein